MAENILLDWVNTQNHSLKNLLALLKKTILLCNTEVEQINQDLLQIYINSINMHIEVVSQYNTVINTQIKNMSEQETLHIQDKINEIHNLQEESIEEYHTLVQLVILKVAQFQNQIEHTEKMLSVFYT